MLTALLAAGCAAVPPETAPALQDAAQSSAAPTEIETITLGAAELDGSHVVTCRDELKTGSNVIVQRCMTRANWERYERFREIEAKEMLRVLQGSAYR